VTKDLRLRIASIDHYQVDESITIRGSTEKDVLRDPNTGHCYIAKLGRRNNDLEVMTEYAIYLIGRSLGIPVAEARLGRYKGQLRFMSRYFLDRDKAEELVHGMQLFSDLYGQATISGVLKNTQREQAMFNVQAVSAAFGAHYYELSGRVEADLFRGFVGMLTHDALIGVMDRHHENWGVIVRREVEGQPPRFAPLYDSARGLFCNEKEATLVRYWGAKGDEHLGRYVALARPLVGFEGLQPAKGRHYITHDQLVAEIFYRFPSQRAHISSILGAYRFRRVQEDLACYLRDLCSAQRRHLILNCLRRRWRLIHRAINARMH
jgi:hypothetical protein